MKRLRALALGVCLLAPGVAWADASEVRNQAIAAASITPSDSTNITPTAAIFIGDAAACNVALKLQKDSAAHTFTNVQSGSILPVRAIIVLSTGTTCTTIIALYGVN